MEQAGGSKASQKQPGLTYRGVLHYISTGHPIFPDIFLSLPSRFHSILQTLGWKYRTYLQVIQLTKWKLGKIYVTLHHPFLLFDSPFTYFHGHKNSFRIEQIDQDGKGGHFKWQQITFNFQCQLIGISNTFLVPHDHQECLLTQVVTELNFPCISNMQDIENMIMTEIFVQGLFLNNNETSEWKKKGRKNTNNKIMWSRIRVWI